MKAVLDINILVSSVLNRAGLPAHIVDLAIEKRFSLVLSQHILDTFGEVLARPHLIRRVSDEQRGRVRRALVIDDSPVTPDPSVRGIAPDLEDDLVLGTAVAAGADYLVTGDKGLLDLVEFRGVRIVTAEHFLGVLERGE